MSKNHALDQPNISQCNNQSESDTMFINRSQIYYPDMISQNQIQTAKF